ASHALGFEHPAWAAMGAVAVMQGSHLHSRHAAGRAHRPHDRRGALKPGRPAATGASPPGSPARLTRSGTLGTGKKNGKAIIAFPKAHHRGAPGRLPVPLSLCRDQAAWVASAWSNWASSVEPASAVVDDWPPS